MSLLPTNTQKFDFASADLFLTENHSNNKKLRLKYTNHILYTNRSCNFFYFIAYLYSLPDSLIVYNISLNIHSLINLGI